MVDITEILVHWHAGRSQNEIAASLGVDRKTIRKYVVPAEAAGLRPGGEPVAEAEWAKRITEWFPHLTDTSLRQVTWEEIGKHHDYITSQLAVGVTAATIHQRLRAEHGLEASVASLRRYIRANLPEETRRASVTADPVQAPGAVIKAARQAKGWSQTELGQRCACSASTVSRLESGQQLYDLKALRTLAEVLDIPSRGPWRSARSSATAGRHSPVDSSASSPTAGVAWPAAGSAPRGHPGVRGQTPRA